VSGIISRLTIFPNGTVAWPRWWRPAFELRGGATVEPPSLDIGADILNIERRPAEPSRITICRQSPEDAGYREIFVSLDGESIAMLEAGDTFTCEVKPGPHKLRAHNTLFWKTHHIVLRPGEHAKFIAINRTGPISFGLLFMLGAFPLYLTFEREVEKLQDPSSRIQAPNQTSR
jgi:hypothetical protein